MKRWKYWIISILLCQFCLYLYLDRVVLAPVAKFSQEAVDTGPEPKTLTAGDNTSLARISGKSVRIYGIDRGLIREITLSSEGDVTFFDYLRENDATLLGITRDSSSSTTLGIEIHGMQRKKPLIMKLEGLSRGARLNQITFSSPADLIGLLVHSGENASIYRGDPSGRLRKISVNTTHIQRISGLSKEDGLVFDNSEKGKIYWLSSKNEVKEIPVGQGSYALLGTDEAQRIYAGKLNEKGKVTQIYIGDRTGYFQLFHRLLLVAEAGDIRVTGAGEILFE